MTGDDLRISTERFILLTDVIWKFGNCGTNVQVPKLGGWGGVVGHWCWAKPDTNVTIPIEPLGM